VNGQLLRGLLTAAIVILLVGLGWWLVRDSRESIASARAAKRGVQSAPARLIDTPNVPPKGAERDPSRRRQSLEDLMFGIPNERLVRFSTDEAYQRFLAGLDGSGLRLLGQLDRFRTLRIGYDDLADLEGLLGDDDKSYGNYAVWTPIPPDVKTQPGAQGFGNSTLQWLGITGDTSGWGSGVKVAILDTGVTAHTALPEGIREIDLLRGDEAVTVNGHGTAVASLIVGNHGESQGIAPAAELLSIRIGDENGSSNSFLLAEGIVTAVDEGAQLINISMGSEGDSALVRDAVAYAAENGVLIIASSGNDGLDSPSFPAGYESVVAVGAVDRGSDYLNFSNEGSALDAPGYSLNAAWTDERFILFTGTSASAPIVSGAVIATMSEMGLPAAQAYELVVANLNEAGAPGNDPFYGEGILNVGRVMNSEVAGIYDAAAASNYFQLGTADDPTSRVLVTVENRGTELLTNTQVDITVPDGTYPQTIPSLAPGQIRTIALPLNILTTTESFLIQTTVNVTGSASDQHPADNGLTTKVSLIPISEVDPGADPGP
jgi:hypothetical protein